jgi:transcriptional regulator with XRE-family HTH domain
VDTEQEFAGRLGAAIRRARTARQWSQAVLAERLDVSVDYVGMLERGERLPSFATLFQVAALFGVPPLALLSAPEDESWVAEAIGLLHALPPEARTMVLSMLRAAAGSTPAPTRSKRRRP